MDFGKSDVGSIRWRTQLRRPPAAQEPGTRRTLDRYTVRAASKAMPRIAGFALMLAAAGMPVALHAQNLDAHRDSQIWKSLRGCQDMEGTRLYKQLQPKGRFVAQADECLAWDETKRCEKIETVREFQKKFPKSPHLEEARICAARLEARDRLKALVERLLTECRAHHDANRLTAGSGGNALDCYRRVLDKDPGNAQALKGITRIEQHYVDKARSALEREWPDVAERWIARLSKINPEHPQVEALNASLRELRRRLEEHERVAAAHENLRREVDALLAQGKPEQARARIAASRGAGLSGKSLTALEEKVEKALAERARALSAKLGAIRSSIAQGRINAARKSLAEARALGLDDRTRKDLLAAIGKAEAALAAKARAAEVRRLWGECEGHGSEGRLRAALTCSEEVAKLDPNHADAASAVRRLKVMVAFEDASEKDSVEAYFAFEQAHAMTAEATVARFLLTKKEDGYWKSILKVGTRVAYERYLEIYPAGRYAALARTELARGG